MFVRNFLTSGECLTVVPIGLQVTLQYSEKGHIEKVYRGYQDNKVDVTDKLLHVLLTNSIVPHSINIKEGTSWISGILYTGKRFEDSGRLPECVQDKLCKYFIENPNNFNFFAAFSDSQAITFTTPMSAKSWLTSLGFNVLPSLLIPANMTETTFEHYFNTEDYTFNYPQITDFVVYKLTGIRVYNLGFHQIKVTKIKPEVDAVGRIYADIYENDTCYRFNYPDIVKYNVQIGSCIWIDEESNIMYCDSTNGVRRVSNTFKCMTCGRLLTIPADGPFMCSDENCNSRLYPRVCHMLQVLNLPSMSKERYDEITSKVGDIFSVIDVLDEPEYVDIPISARLADLIRAVIPISIVNDANVLNRLCNNCHNSKDTLSYYLTHPQRISTDLDIDDPKLVNWLSSPENSSDVTSILSMPNVTITNASKTMDVEPIFRNVTIYITGRFHHGTTKDVTTILESYAANVASTFDENVDCIITGDSMEDINGNAIKSANALNIPIFTEQEFFVKHNIDADIKQNL